MRFFPCNLVNKIKFSITIFNCVVCFNRNPGAAQACSNPVLPMTNSHTGSLQVSSPSSSAQHTSFSSGTEETLSRALSGLGLQAMVRRHRAHGEGAKRLHWDESIVPSLPPAQPGIIPALVTKRPEPHMFSHVHYPLLFLFHFRMSCIPPGPVPSKAMGSTPAAPRPRDPWGFDQADAMVESWGA